MREACALGFVKKFATLKFDLNSINVESDCIRTSFDGSLRSGLVVEESGIYLHAVVVCIPQHVPEVIFELFGKALRTLSFNRSFPLKLSRTDRDVAITVEG